MAYVKAGRIFKEKNITPAGKVGVFYFSDRFFKENH
jgi:hypothetical protein